MVPAVYRLLGLRYLVHRWDRAALIVASIALGVATLVSSTILNRCVETAAQDTTTPAGAADLYVTNGEAGVAPAVADDLRANPVAGVRAVQPLVYDRVTLPGLDGRIAVLIGAEVSSQLLTPDNPLKAVVQPTGYGPILQLAPVLGAVQDGDFAKAGELWEQIPGRLVMVSRPIYDAWQAAGAGPFVVRFAGRSVECLPVGVVEFAADSPLAPLGKNFVGMAVGQAARLLRPGPGAAAATAAGVAVVTAHDAAHPPKVNRIDVFFDPNLDDAGRDATAAAVAKAVAGRAKVQTPDAQRRSTQEVVSGLQIGFLVCAAGAMIVGLFLVYNAMAVTVAERRTDIGIMRALGGTRSQVVGLFVVVAGVLGLVGAVLGVPLGILLAEVTLGQFEEQLQSMFLSPDVNPTRVTWVSAAWAVFAGVATAVFAALVPAVQAAADDPANAARRSGGRAGKGWAAAHRLICAGLVGGGLLMIVGRAWLPPRYGSIGGMMVALVGLLLSAPILVGGMIRLVQPVVRRVGPIELRLAFDNLSRAPGRTGVVIGALGAGVALMFQTAGVGRSNEEPVVAWISQVVQADHFVFSGNMTTANSSNSPMGPQVAADLRTLPGVERVMGIRYARPEFNGTVVYVIALDAVDYVRATRSRVPDGLPEIEQFLALPGTDDVLVSENFARRHGVAVGQVVAVPGPSGPVRLRVVGTVRDYSWSRGTIFMDRARYAELFRDDLIDICHVFVGPQAGAGGGVETYASERGLFATDRDSLRRFLSELINRVYLLAYLQQIVVAIVAALGVVTALLISVLQRRRELGLLLAVGATPGQVLRSVLWEAALMGVFGTALGVLIGLPMEVYVLKVVLVEESGFVFDVVVPWRQAFGIAAAAILTATLAGLLPAIHAVRTRIPDAIQWE